MINWKRLLRVVIVVAVIIVAILCGFGLYRIPSKIIASAKVRAEYREVRSKELGLRFYYPYDLHEEIIPICLIDDKGNMLSETIDLDNNNRIVQIKLSIESVVYSKNDSEVICYNIPSECFDVGAELCYDSITDKYTYVLGDYYANLSLTKSQLDASCDRMTKSRDNYTSQMDMLSFKTDSLKNEYDKYSKHIRWIVGPLLY
jgi:lipopolysaccharide export LptBFGC system permease protein LptF